MSKLLSALVFTALMVLLTGCQHAPLSLPSPTPDKSQKKITIEGYSGQLLAGTISPLLDFVQADYDKAIATDKLVLLYFYADWCPICRLETQEALYPAFDELVTNEVIGFRVNFKDGSTDTDEQELARKYDVPYQHYKVLIRSGTVVKTSNEQWNKDRYLQELEDF